MINEANTGFMLLCSSLVMLMTPGLAFFYGGLVGRKNVLAIMMQCFVSMGWTTVHLVAVGYRCASAAERRRSSATSTWPSCAASRPGHAVPPSTHPAARAHRLPDDVRDHHPGADHRRLRQPRHVQGLPAVPDVWLLFVYFPFVHMIWGGGILAKWGVLDFAGGIVVHNIAGLPRWHRSCTSAGARWRTRAAQHPAGRPGHRPALVRLVRLQRRQRVPGRPVTAVAFLNTDVAASFAAITWLVVDWWHEKQADVRRPADRRGGRPGHDHAGRRVTSRSRLGDHRHRRRRRLLLRGRAQEPPALGRRARRLGRPRRGRLPGDRPAGRLRHHRLQSRRRRTG